ncbi:MAG: hypothetical protein H0X66_11290 [Verrucomicrobia bacterium]|nr:hypothetical protein [Verrucomicrobiota bacterium]
MATLIVVILLGIMTILLMANSRSLSQLKMQLDAVEARQLQKFKPPVADRPEVQQTPVVP